MSAKTEIADAPPLQLGPLARVRLLFVLLLACDQTPFATLWAAIERAGRAGGSPSRCGPGGADWI